VAQVIGEPMAAMISAISLAALVVVSLCFIWFAPRFVRFSEKEALYFSFACLLFVAGLVSLLFVAKDRSLASVDILLAVVLFALSKNANPVRPTSM